jgi:hypothetical protein
MLEEFANILALVGDSAFRQAFKKDFAVGSLKQTAIQNSQNAPVSGPADQPP